MRTHLISLLVFLSCGGSLAQQSWLQPSDTQITSALDSGFSGSKRHHHVFTFDPQKTKVGDDYVNSGITVLPPLVCAYGLGQGARAKLLEKPEASQVKAECYGKIIVTAVHISSSLGANWPVIIERKGERLQPSSSTMDTNPAVISYQTLFLGDQVGYRYQDGYVFTPKPDWTSDLALTYSDDSGTHHTIAVRTVVFEK